MGLGPLLLIGLDGAELSGVLQPRDFPEAGDTAEGDGGSKVAVRCDLGVLKHGTRRRWHREVKKYRDPHLCGSKSKS